jgi:hypothetical protein
MLYNSGGHRGRQVGIISEIIPENPKKIPAFPEMQSPGQSHKFQWILVLYGQ